MPLSGHCDLRNQGFRSEADAGICYSLPGGRPDDLVGRRDAQLVQELAERSECVGCRCAVGGGDPNPEALGGCRADPVHRSGPAARAAVAVVDGLRSRIHADLQRKTDAGHALQRPESAPAEQQSAGQQGSRQRRGAISDDLGDVREQRRLTAGQIQLAAPQSAAWDIRRTSRSVPSLSLIRDLPAADTPTCPSPRTAVTSAEPRFTATRHRRTCEVASRSARDAGQVRARAAAAATATATAMASWTP